MPDLFVVFDRLQKEWPVIAGAPLSFLLTVLIVSIIIGLAIRWHYGSIIAQKDEQLKTRDDRLTAREQVISEYRERQKADLEIGGRVLSTERKWLSDLAEKDRMAVEMAVLILDCKMGLFLNEDPAYVSFEFKFYNGSVYPILVNTVEGHILFGKKRLEEPITISTKWAPVHVHHAKLHHIEIFQYLTKEEADIIQHDLTEPDHNKRTSFQFNFKHLRLMIEGGVDGESVVRKPMRFHRDAAISLGGKLIAI